MARRVRTLAAVAALAAAMTVAVPAARASTAAHPNRASAVATTIAPEGLSWTDCRDGMQCTSIEVPVQHDAPNGQRMSVAVARLPAADPARRIGSLVVNPGGPGLSAIDVLGGIAGSLPTEVTDRFDVVAIDPRGVGRSGPVDCGVPLDPVFDQSFAPDSTHERDALVAAVRTVAEACAAREGDRLRAVSTLDTARDMDVVRERLGDEQLTYLGFSYGTYLGGLYAALFPERVRALVLDGAIDPTIDARTSTMLQARGFEASLDQFLDWCATDDGCAFASDGEGEGHPAEAYDALRARIVDAPIEVDPDVTGDRAGTTRFLNDTRFDAAVLLALYQGRAAWRVLADALAAADGGSGEQLLVAADRFFGREPGGGDDGTVEAFWAVGCLDDPTAEGVDGLQRRAEQVAPRLGAFVANFSLACTVWPTNPSAAATATSTSSPSASTPAAARPSMQGVAPGALVVGTTDDPATPLVGAKRLARLLGDAALVVASGNRHTAIGAGNECVDQAVARYLVSPGDPMPARRRC